MDNKFTQKSYTKSKTVRKLIRNQIFQRNRETQINTNYISNYPQNIQQSIRHSLQCQIPTNIPIHTIISTLGTVTRQNISIFRRICKPVYKTKMDVQNNYDLHMTYQSLWGLAGIQDIQSYQNYHKIIKQFQDNLSQYLAMPYPQIKQMAIIAAGNKILGKQDDILSIINHDLSQLWVLINHIYERKIPFSTMYTYLSYYVPIVYKTIYQMTNNQKDQIIQSLIKNQYALEIILQVLTKKQQKDTQNIGKLYQNLQIKLYCVRIIGNMLAERDDYYEIFMKWGLLDRVCMLLKELQGFNMYCNGDNTGVYRFKQDIKKDIMWMISNYICDQSPANQLLCSQGLLQKILLSYKNQSSLTIKSHLYHIIAYLTFYGNRYKIYKIALQQKILQQCCIDIQVQNQQMTLIILNLISKLIQIGQQFVQQNNQQIQIAKQRNPFIYFILYSKLKAYIHTKTYNQNLDISDISFRIMDQIDQYQIQFGNIDSDM